MHKLNVHQKVKSKQTKGLVAETLTGARDNALNMSKAPNISIRKPINQALFKAYALITYNKPHTQITHLSKSSTCNTNICLQQNQKPNWQLIQNPIP